MFVIASRLFSVTSTYDEAKLDLRDCEGLQVATTTGCRTHTTVQHSSGVNCLGTSMQC